MDEVARVQMAYLIFFCNSYLRLLLDCYRAGYRVLHLLLNGPKVQTSRSLAVLCLFLWFDLMKSVQLTKSLD